MWVRVFVGLIKKYYDILCAKQQNAVRNKINVMDIYTDTTTKSPGNLNFAAGQFGSDSIFISR